MGAPATPFWALLYAITRPEDTFHESAHQTMNLIYRFPRLGALRLLIITYHIK